jgi:hypothetical protein
VFIFAEVEALLVSDLVRLSKLPLLALIIVTEKSFHVTQHALIEWHDPCRIYFQICYLVFP